MKKENTAPVWRRLLKAALLFAPIAVLIAVVNVTVDPASLFQRGYEANVAAIITSGQNASNLKNMDDRRFQQNCAQLLPHAPHTLVLGSSRCMQLTAQITGCQTMFNGGVTNGDLRDMISLYRLYGQLGKQPQRVILMADYGLFNPNKLDNRAYTQGYSEFAAATGTQEMKTARSTEKWKQLFSLTYFQSAIDFAFSGKNNSLGAVATTAYETDTDMRRADGSYSYGPSFRNMTAEQRIETGKSKTTNLPWNMGVYAEPSPVLRTQFELFVAQLQADGVQVILQLPPINPYVYDAMQQDEVYAAYLEMEEYFRSFAAEYDIAIFGSYDPGKIGLQDIDFYDALHCSMEATAAYFPEELRCDCGANG